MKINHIELKNESDILPCTLKDTKVVFSPTEVDKYRKITPESHLDPKCKRHLFLHLGDIGCIKLITMDIDTGDRGPQV